MVSRHILAKVDPGSTPKKRKAPDGQIDGQIRRPPADPLADGGAAGAPPPPEPPKSPASRKAAKAAMAIAAAASSSSDSDAPSSQNEPDADTVVLDAEPAPAKVPPEMGNSPEFRAQILISSNFI